MIQNKLHKILCFMLCITFFASCIKDNFELEEKFSDQIEWNPSLALPIATANLTMKDLAKERQDTLEYISETTLGYGTNEDDKVVQFTYVIDTARVIDVMHLPIIDPFDTIVYLKPVEISSVSFPIGYVSLRDLIQDNFSEDDYNEYMDAAPIATMPEKSAITEHRYPIGEIPESAKEYILANFGEDVNVKDVFEYIILKSGTIRLSCTNTSGFNFYCDIVIGSYNENGEYVEFSTFDYSNYPNWISPGGPQKRIAYADSSYLNSDFYYSFRNLRIANATTVAVDYDEVGLLLNIEMEDLVAYSGKAYVPEQELSMDTTLYMTMKDEDENRKLFNVLVDKGAFHYDIESTIGIATEFIAEFPSIDSMGVTPVRKTASMTNEVPTYSADWQLANSNIDLTQNPTQPYNSLPIKIGYRVHTTGGMLEFGSGQYISIHITNTDSIFFAYATGDLGKFDQKLFTETIDFDLNEFVEDYMSGDIVFYDPKVSVSLDNPVGIGGSLELNMVGKKDGESVSVFEGYENSWSITRPTCEEVQVGQATPNTIKINKSTSNIVDFVKLLPNTIEYSGTLHVNSEYADGESIYNCVSNKGTAKLGVEIELPLNLSAKNLILRQDVDLDLSDLGDLSSIEKLRLYINTEHQLPVKALLQLSLLDTTQPVGMQQIGLLDLTVLEAATTDDKGKVDRSIVQKTQDEITLEKGDPLLDDFLKANKLQVEVYLETDKGGDSPVIIYSYYGLKLNMAADCKFIYTKK